MSFWQNWKVSEQCFTRRTKLTAMCSLDCTGWNPTKEICIDRMVPKQYTWKYKLFVIVNNKICWQLDIRYSVKRTMEITNNRRGDCTVARTLISRNYAHNGAEPSIRAATHNTFYGWAHLMLKVESQRWHYKFLWDVTGESLSLWLLNPLSPNIHMQILQTDLYTFPSWMSWENLIKDQSVFS